MKEYPNGGVTPQQKYYGPSFFKAHMVIECSFRCLNARFATLKRARDINMDRLPFVICASLVLHNYCETIVIEQSINSALQYDRNFQAPSTTTNNITDNNEPRGNEWDVCSPNRFRQKNTYVIMCNLMICLLIQPHACVRKLLCQHQGCSGPLRGFSCSLLPTTVI